MSTIQTLAAETKSWFPGIEPLALPPFVRRAFLDIRDARKWSFLMVQGQMFVPGQITAGTVTTTQFNNQIIFDATAAPALNAVALAAPPQPVLTQRQFRLTGGPIYNIVAWAMDTPSAGLGTATLDRPFAESSVSGLSYMVYLPYVPTPRADFVKFLSIADPINDYRIRRRNLYRSTAEIDRRDPNRQAFSIPIWSASHDYATLPSGIVVPRYEWWPHGVQEINYNVAYQVRGTYADTDPLPLQVSDATIIARARYYCYQFQITQPNVPKEMIGALSQAGRTVSAEYADLLQKDKRQDDEIAEQDVFENESDPQWSGPVDSDYALSHDYFIV